MNDVEAARKAWLVERPTHIIFGDLIRGRLNSKLRKLGFWFEVSSRAKDLDSLVKKLLKKRDHTYDSLPDKVGVRVILRYRSDIEPVIKSVLNDFACESTDDKFSILGTDRVGYQSVHVDRLRLRAADPDCAAFPPDKFWAELQIRTLAQHLWSEMSHDTIYKNDEMVRVLPPDLKRRVNLMAGQIEVADREFDRLNRLLPVETQTEILKALERHYYTLASRRPDTELSLQTLATIVPLYHMDDPAQIISHLDLFFEEKRAVFESVFANEQVVGNQEGSRSSFLYQPEVIMLYERLLNDPIEVRRAWNEEFPESELERVANIFGMSFD